MWLLKPQLPHVNNHAWQLRTESPRNQAVRSYGREGNLPIERPFEKPKEEGDSMETERKRMRTTGAYRICEVQQKGKEAPTKLSAPKDSPRHKISSPIEDANAALQ